MKLFLSTLGFLFIAAWLIEMWFAKRSRERRDRDQARERETLRHITQARRWWKEPEDDDLGDH